MTNKSVIILGHRGFIGRHLFAHLTSNLGTREYQIIGFSSKEADLRNLSELDQIKQTLDENCTVIFCSAVMKWLEDSPQSYLANMQMVVNILEILSECPPQELLYFSSAAVYGEGQSNEHITENTTLSPTTFYGNAKLAAEQLINFWAKGRSTTNVAILRPSLVYGADTERAFYLPRQFAESIVRKEPVALWGDGSEVRNFIEIGDLCRIVEKMILDRAKGTFNLVSPHHLSYRQIVEQLGEFAGLKPKIIEKPRTRPKIDLKFDNSKILRWLGADKFTDPDLGLKRIILEIDKLLSA